MQEKLADVVEIARECQALKGRIIAQAEKDIVALSLAISEKVMKKVEDDPSVAFDIIRDLAERVQNAEQVAIRASKGVEMMDGLMKNGDNGTPDGEASSWRWVPDAGVQPGGCIVETEFGRLDARLDTRLLDVSQALLELLDGE